ncbi:toxin-antitoxin system HicB family antitoxin [Chengkuizengella sp. SCS-71B]
MSPKSLHKKLAIQAEHKEISLNQYMLHKLSRPN